MVLSCVARTEEDVYALRKDKLPPPIFNEPIFAFSVDPVKVAGFEICGVNSTDIGAIKGVAMGGQGGYLRSGSRK